MSSKAFLMSHTTTAASTGLIGGGFRKQSPSMQSGHGRNSGHLDNQAVLAISQEELSTYGESTQQTMHTVASQLQSKLKISDLAIFQLLKAFKLQQYA